MSYLTVKIHSLTLPKNAIGLYRPEDHDEINFYHEPSFSSEKLPKLLIANKNYNSIYQVTGIDSLIHDSIGITGWIKYKDKTNKKTWIKVSQDKSIWAPFKYYICSDSEDESEGDYYYEDI